MSLWRFKILPTVKKLYIVFLLITLLPSPDVRLARIAYQFSITLIFFVSRRIRMKLQQSILGFLAVLLLPVFALAGNGGTELAAELRLTRL